MKRVIGCDVDGILADFNTGFIDLIVAIAGRDLFPPRPFDIPCWDYPQEYGYTAEEVAAVWAHIQVSATFWASLAPYPDAEEMIRYLRAAVQAMDDVYFVTSRPGLTAKLQTERWLRKLGFGSPTVLISSNKGYVARALSFDVYIDDRWENVVDVAQWAPRTKVMLMDRPWNRAPEHCHADVVRVDSVVGI